ncbi:MAG: hypothetical protein WCD79_01670 [Chthoniobacteraceae bacterium]
MNSSNLPFLKPESEIGVWHNPLWKSDMPGLVCRKPGLFFFIVGLSEYDQDSVYPNLSLKGPAAGAHHLFEWLNHNYQHSEYQLARGYFIAAPAEGEEVGMKQTARSDFEALRKALINFRKMVVNAGRPVSGGGIDCSHLRVLIYLSGHGFAGKDSDLLFLPSKSDTEEQVLSQRHILDSFERLNLNVLVSFFDCCRVEHDEMLGNIVPDSIFSKTQEQSIDPPASVFTIHSTSLRQPAKVVRKKGFTLLSEALRKTLDLESDNQYPTLSVTWARFIELLKQHYSEINKQYEAGGKLDFVPKGDGLNLSFYFPKHSMSPALRRSKYGVLLEHQGALLDTLRKAFPDLSKLDAAFQWMQKTNNLQPLPLEKILPRSTGTQTIEDHAVAFLQHFHQSDIAPEHLLKKLIEFYAEKEGASVFVLTFWRDLAAELENQPDAQPVPSLDRCYIPQRPFVGRQSFREAVRSLLVPDGSMRAVIVRGESGSGKSYSKELIHFALEEPSIANRIILLAHDPENNRSLTGFSDVLDRIFHVLDPKIRERLKGLESLDQLMQLQFFLQNKQLWFLFDGLPSNDHTLFLDLLNLAFEVNDKLTLWLAEMRFIFIEPTLSTVQNNLAEGVHIDRVEPIVPLDLNKFIRELRRQELTLLPPFAVEVPENKIQKKAFNLYAKAEKTAGGLRARHLAINRILREDRKQLLSDGNDPFWDKKE